MKNASPRTPKPFYEDGDHVLYSDIIADLTPMQALYLPMMYERITFGHHAVRLGVSAGINVLNNVVIDRFAGQCVVHWEFKAKVADMFTSPSKRGILH